LARKNGERGCRKENGRSEEAGQFVALKRTPMVPIAQQVRQQKAKNSPDDKEYVVPLEKSIKKAEEERTPSTLVSQPRMVLNERMGTRRVIECGNGYV